MKKIYGGIFALTLAACATPQRLSESIYRHEEAVYFSMARGDYVVAAAHKRAADAERFKLARIERSWVTANPW